MPFYVQKLDVRLSENPTSKQKQQFYILISIKIINGIHFCKLSKHILPKDIE